MGCDAGHGNVWACAIAQVHAEGLGAAPTPPTVAKMAYIVVGKCPPTLFSPVVVCVCVVACVCYYLRVCLCDGAGTSGWLVILGPIAIDRTKLRLGCTWNLCSQCTALAEKSADMKVFVLLCGTPANG